MSSAERFRVTPRWMEADRLAALDEEEQRLLQQAQEGLPLSALVRSEDFDEEIRLHAAVCRLMRAGALAPLEELQNQSRSQANG